MFGSSRSGGARRRSTGIRVLVGLSPVLLLGGLVIAEKVSALTSDPQLAGSAVAVPDQPAVAPAKAAELRALARNDVTEVAPAVDSPDSLDGSRLPQITKEQLFSIPTPATSAAPNGPDITLPPVRPDERRRAFDGWGTVVDQELSPAHGRPEARLAQWTPEDSGLASQSISPDPRPVTVPQPTWEPAPVASGPEDDAIQGERPDRPEDAGQGASSTNLDPEPALSSVPGDGLLDRARVVIHRPRDNSAPDARDLLGRLNARGVGEAEIRTVGINVSRADVRYFHAADRAIAEEVRRMLRRQGYTPELRDFTNYRPLPSRGSVEVWMPG